MKMKAVQGISRAGRGRFLSAKRSVRQMLSFALAFAMLASLLPGTALAADVEHTGHDGLLAPRSGATRAEMAAMLMRFCESIIK